MTNCTAVVFSRCRRLPNRLYIGDTPLLGSHDVKYLGLHLDHHLTWLTYSKHVSCKTGHHLYKLHPLLYSNSMTHRLRKLIVTTDVVTHVIPEWAYLAKTDKRKLQLLLD